MRTPAVSLFCAAAALILAAPSAARAQVGISATVESDFRYRGISLSNEDPDAKIGLSYDHPSGAYAGAAVMAGDTTTRGLRVFGYNAYAGFAKRLRSGLVLDVGASELHVDQSDYFALPGARPGSPPVKIRYAADYPEVYVGATRGDVSARVYFSPYYVRDGLKTVYLDLSAARRPVARLRLFAHAGLLAAVEGRFAANARTRYDLRAGAAYEFPHGELQLSWSHVGGAEPYVFGQPQKRDALLASISGFF